MEDQTYLRNILKVLLQEFCSIHVENWSQITGHLAIKTKDGKFIGFVVSLNSDTAHVPQENKSFSNVCVNNSFVKENLSPVGKIGDGEETEKSPHTVDDRDNDLPLCTPAVTEMSSGSSSTIKGRESISPVIKSRHKSPAKLKNIFELGSDGAGRGTFVRYHKNENWNNFPDPNAALRKLTYNDKISILKTKNARDSSSQDQTTSDSLFVSQSSDSVRCQNMGPVSTTDSAKITKLDSAKLDSAKLDSAKLDSAKLDSAKLDSANQVTIVEDTSSESKSVHKCLICGKLFAYKRSLHLHIKTIHFSTEKHMRCHVCSKVFSSNVYFEKHQCYHDCTVCGKKFKTSRLLTSHKKNMHSDRCFECKICEKKFPTNWRLLHHKTTVHSEERPFQCDQCGKRFKSSGVLSGHKNQVHLKMYSVRKTEVCEICGKSVRSDQLNTHRRWHSAERPYPKCHKCSICHKAFARPCALKEHLNAHAGALLACDVCGKKYAHKDSLNYHKKVVHLGEKPYSCAICKKSFAKKQQLTSHMPRHTSKCLICGESFYSLGRLRAHKRAAHYHERTHKCLICEKLFANKYSLQYHNKRMHSDERPHKCSICQRGYVNKSQLNKHMTKKAQNCSL